MKQASTKEIKSEEREGYVRPYIRFQRLARAIRICMIIKSEPYKKERDVLSDVNHYVTFKEYAEQMRQRSIGLNFNPNYYKANRQLRVSAETRKILLTKSERRTQAQMHQVLLALRSIRSFAEYPKRMQSLLVQECWYESHNSQKIILRQGHRPTAFYFILSGSVVVKKMTSNQTFAKTVCHLKRGDSFGELSIIHSTVRQATIISESDIELLGISDSDFIRIFMTSSAGGKNLHDPDFFTFIREVDFLKGWPIELLPKNQKDCLFNFFKTGSVLVKDSRFSDWIYVIKSGSCDILKELKHPYQRQPEQNDYKEETSRHNKQQRIRSAPTRQQQQQSRTTQHIHGLFVTKVDIQPRVRRKKNIKPIMDRAPNKSQQRPQRQQHHRLLVLDSEDQEGDKTTKESQNEGETQHTVECDDRLASNERKCFVKIKTLQKGESFGLQNMLCLDQPSLSLVSNGAEILMISKKFYNHHLGNQTKQNLEMRLMRYPREEVLQKNLKIETDWRTYKNSVVKNVIKNRRCRTAHI